jgi:NitT/TauT family transport system substrate-binding protein
MRKLGALLLVLAFLTAGCFGKTGGSAGQTPGGSTTGGTTPGATDTPALKPLSPAVHVRIAEDGSPSGAGFYIADAKGYFKALGLDVEIKPFESSGDMLPAIASGDIDVAGGITGANLFNAVARGLDIRMIADKGTNFEGKSYYNLVVRKDLLDQIKDYKDLKGRKIGVFSVGTLNEYTVEKALEKGGLTVNDVTLVPLGPPDMNVALANKSIDVGMQIEPLITQGQQSGISVPWKETTDFLPGGQIAVVLAGPKFVENTPVAQRFMVAYLQGLRDYNDAFRKGKNTDEIIDILAKYSEVKDKNVWKAVRVTGLNPNGYVSSESLIDQYQWYRKKGTVQADVDVNKVIDMSLVHFAVQYLGEYK